MEAENSQVGNDIEFSYNLKAGMKIDVEATKKKLADKEKMKQENQKKFEELQKQMEKKAESMPIKTPKNLTNNKLDSEDDNDDNLD